MKTYKTQLRELGLSWDWRATKGQLKALIRGYNDKQKIAYNKTKNVLKICGLSDDYDLNHIHLHIDDLAKFVNFRKRLPTFDEVKSIRSSINFKFWFNKEMNGDDYNSVWVYPSEIYSLYKSL